MNTPSCILSALLKKAFLPWALCLCLFFTDKRACAIVPSLSGGLVYPAFSTAALVDPAAMAMDWRKESSLRYSPPLSSQDPQAYLGSFAYSNSFFATNVLTSGSYQNGIAYQGLAGSVSLHLGRGALGLALRKPNLASNQELQTDVSALFQVTDRWRVGSVFYHLNDKPQVAVGLGVGRLKHWTVAGDLLFPLQPRGNSLVDQYAATLSVTQYWHSFGASCGVKYDRTQDGFNQSSQIIGQAEFTVSVTERNHLFMQYRTDPQAVVVGWSWVVTPSSQEFVREIAEKNHDAIWK